MSTYKPDINEPHSLGIKGMFNCEAGTSVAASMPRKLGGNQECRRVILFSTHIVHELNVGTAGGWVVITYRLLGHMYFRRFESFAKFLMSPKCVLLRKGVAN